MLHSIDRLSALYSRRDFARQDLLDLQSQRERAADPDVAEDLDDEIVAARARLARAETALHSVYGGAQ